MATPYTPSKKWDATGNLPDDADLPVAAAWNVGAEWIADRTQYLYEAMYGALGVGAPIHIPLGFPLYNPNSRWGFIVGVPTNVGWEQTDVTDAGDLWWPVPTPPVGLIASVTALVDGNGGTGGGAHGALPALPVLTLYRQDLTGGASAQVATITDPSINLAEYEAIHPITLPGLTESINGNRTWFVSLQGESGGAAVGAELKLLTIFYTLAPAP